MSECEDISQLPEEEKFRIYDQIGPDRKLVLVQDLQWPFIRVTYPNPQASELARKRYAKKDRTICFITDILSVEKWFCLKRGHKHFAIFPPVKSSCYKYGGFAIAVATEEDAIKEATAYYKKRRKYLRVAITRENGWQIKEDDQYFQSFFLGV
jgi:hypothetical protein